MDYEFWLKVIGAFGVTVGLLLNWRSHSERTTFEMIDRLYMLCHTLESHILREWRLSHLFCIGEDDYLITKARVAKDLSQEERDEFLVKEKLFAVHVFIVYEQVLYQLENSAKPLHRKRRKFLREMLDYFTERLLLNPRLRGFLELDPNGESLHLESKSARKLLDAQRGYQKKRAAQDKTAIPIKYDLYGPFSNEGQQGLLETRN